MGDLTIQGLVHDFMSCLQRIGALSEEDGDEFFDALSYNLQEDGEAQNGAEQVAEFLAGDE